VSGTMFDTGGAVVSRRRSQVGRAACVSEPRCWIQTGRTRHVSSSPRSVGRGARALRFSFAGCASG
jgi:hypothetical protein